MPVFLLRVVISIFAKWPSNHCGHSFKWMYFETPPAFPSKRLSASKLKKFETAHTAVIVPKTLVL
jgi:hypothetical protein